MIEMPEATASDFACMLPMEQWERMRRGEFRGGDDIRALRRGIRMSQRGFAEAMGISVHTLRNWEQGRRRPEGPALALLRVAARHPRVIRGNAADSGRRPPRPPTTLSP